VQLSVLCHEDFKELTSRNEELLILKNRIISNCLQETLKYDYDRMVYSSINQMSRAQEQARRKQEQEKNILKELRNPFKNNSEKVGFYHHV